MASIHKEISLAARPEDVWDAVADFGAVHTRLVPGFVRDAKLDGEARTVTFANSSVARELLVDCDHARRRLVYAVISERVKQHSASVQVFAAGETGSRLVWIVEVIHATRTGSVWPTDRPTTTIADPLGPRSVSYSTQLAAGRPSWPGRR